MGKKARKKARKLAKEEAAESKKVRNTSILHLGPVVLHICAQINEEERSAKTRAGRKEGRSNSPKQVDDLASTTLFRNYLGNDQHEADTGAGGWASSERESEQRKKSKGDVQMRKRASKRSLDDDMDAYWLAGRNLPMTKRQRDADSDTDM